VERLDQLLTARRGLSQSLTRLQQQLAELPHAAPQLREAITALKTQKAALDHEIAELTGDPQTFPAAAELDAVPGIGPVTAATVSACLKAKQFADPDQFVAYVGLDVAVRQSGRRHGELGLTRQGHAELRRLLYLAAQANLRCKDSPFKQQYERERAKGLAKTAALCAVARKLARLCWSLVKHEAKYDPQRVHQSPATTDPTKS
jgi:transposase